MILNRKGWIGLAIIALISASATYIIYEHPAKVVYQKSTEAPTQPTPSLSPTPAIPQVLIADSIVNVRIASSAAAITKGLSGTPSMGQNEGMIFLFPVSDRYRFWMPDMHFSLDMIWISSDMKIVDITKNAPPLIDQSKPIFYQPKKPARYVLEVNAGWSDQHGIVIGQDVQFKSI